MDPVNVGTQLGFPSPWVARICTGTSTNKGRRKQLKDQKTYLFFQRWVEMLASARLSCYEPPPRGGLILLLPFISSTECAPFQNL